MASSVCSVPLFGSLSSSLLSCHGFRKADGSWQPWPSAGRPRSRRSDITNKASGSAREYPAVFSSLPCSHHIECSKQPLGNRAPSCNAISATSLDRRWQGRLRPASALPPAAEKGFSDGGKLNVPEEPPQWKGAMAVSEALPPEGATLLLSCVVGLATGVIVVGFNKGVHGLHDLMWEGTPEIGAAWLRQQPLETTWQRLVFVPVGGGIVVGLLNHLRTVLADVSAGGGVGGSEIWQRLGGVATPALKAVAAVVTLGTGNSLGPEGPSVEIGASVANGLGTVLKNSRERKLALVAAGSAAGISSGFNAAVAGTFFAVESVLRPVTTSPDPSPSLTTAMVLLSSVLASVVSQAGLGQDPTFIVPPFELRSAAELPLYLLLGLLCGAVSVAYTRSSALATQGFDLVSKKYNIPPAFLPPVGALCVGLIALAYPEVLYWGFENLDVVLQSRQPLGNPLAPTTGLLLQLVGVKLVATALCRGSGLVGGVYAPSLFMGAALGSAYAKLAGAFFAAADPRFSFGEFSLAEPQAYALVGMAAMLAGVCQVPLTAVLLLFELTQDYQIILPLMGAVGLSSWVSSLASKSAEEEKRRRKRQAEAERREQAVQRLQNGLSNAVGSNGAAVTAGVLANPTLNPLPNLQTASVGLEATAAVQTVEPGLLNYAPTEIRLSKPSLLGESMTLVENASDWLAASSKGPVLYTNGAPVFLREEKSIPMDGFEDDEGELCSLETSLCVAGPEVMSEEELMSEMTVATAMSQTFMTVPNTATVRETVAAMLASRQWCALVVGEGGVLEGILTLADVQAEAKKTAAAAGGRAQAQALVDTRLVTEVCSNWKRRHGLLTVTPETTLEAAQRAMLPRGLRQLPVIADNVSRRLLGLLDRDNISLACRAEATRRSWALLPDLAERE